ncbi:glycosyltransferase [Acinetobacter thermotolerans]|uniref:glycosyltransferase n=1 Tax=Acinetobacter thermotolerans TaxID=3151487 RepID=UPI00325A7165
MKKVYVLQFSPCSSDNCGIGKYQENFMNIFANYVEIETKFFDPGPYKTRLMKKDEFNVVKHKLAKELESFDILHIQHEFALYSGSQFAQIINIAKSMDKKVVVTIHTSPSVILKSTQLSSFIINYLRQKWRHFRINKNHIYPIRKADLLITHNKNTSNDLNRYGIELNKILQITIPVLKLKDFKHVSTEITEKLKCSPEDIIYAMVGFMNEHKNITDAVKALKYLPEHYKFAIIGGMHPLDKGNIYNVITDLIDKEGLKHRVYITGFVESDDQLNALIREVDICVYPYSNRYYGQASSGALNLAFANECPVIAYPTDSFKELNGKHPANTALPSDPISLNLVPT